MMFRSYYLSGEMKDTFKLRFSDIVFIMVLVVALALGQKMLSLDSDLGRHLTLGGYMLDERTIPTRDLFSHTRTGLSRPPYEWLPQILFTLAYRLLGLDGVILLTSLIIGTTFTLLYKFANRRSGSPLSALIFVLIAAGTSSIHWLPRPHIFTFLLLAIWIEQLDKLAKGVGVAVYTFPIIMLFWANLHGGFIFGILAWIAYFVGWFWETWRNKQNKTIGKNLLIAGSSSLVATIITPDLWHNWDAVLNNRSAYILNRTVETMRPNLTDPSVLPYTLLLLLTILLLTLNWRSIKASHLFLLAGLGLMSLLMARNIPLFAIACTPILSELAHNYFSKFKAWSQIQERFAGFGSTSGQVIWPVLVTFLVFAFFIYFHFCKGPHIFQFDPAVFPVEAANFLEENPPEGNMFNDFNWGGYLLYRSWPRYNVFLDSQSDFYGEDLIREYDQIMSAGGNWEGLLRDYQVDWVLIPANSGLANAMINNDDWKIVYNDNTAMIGIQK